MYHRIAPDSGADRYTVSSREFERQMHALGDDNCRVISLEQAIGELKDPPVQRQPSVCITFDDGFRETYLHAAPVLEKLHFPSTYFLISGLMGGISCWQGEATKTSQHPLVSWSEARELHRAGVELGSHTVSHPVLTQISAARAREEIEKSKHDIEDRLGIPVRYFAYPYGGFNPPIGEMVRTAGYHAACSTLSGFANAANDLFALRRIEIFGGDSVGAFRRKVKFGANEMRSFDIARYYAKRVLSRCLPI